MNDIKPDYSSLHQLFHAETDLEFAVLIGSRASGTSRPDSDWDFALQWKKDRDWLEQLGRTETLRRELARALEVPDSKIDIIDAPTASLAMRATIAEEGVVVKGEDDLPWQHFLMRTWRELEEHYWDQIYAA